MCAFCEIHTKAHYRRGLHLSCAVHEVITAKFRRVSSCTLLYSLSQFLSGTLRSFARTRTRRTLKHVNISTKINKAYVYYALLKNVPKATAQFYYKRMRI